jgi:hypothetical protein
MDAVLYALLAPSPAIAAVLGSVEECVRGGGEVVAEIPLD